MRNLPVEYFSKDLLLRRASKLAFPPPMSSFLSGNVSVYIVNFEK